MRGACRAHFALSRCPSLRRDWGEGIPAFVSVAGGSEKFRARAGLRGGLNLRAENPIIPHFIMMQSPSNDRILTRDTDATVVPSGDAALLPAGTKVNVTHRLGGNFTVVCDVGMFRILGKDADALGETPEAAAGTDGGETTAFGSFGTAEHPDHVGEPDKEALWEALKQVYDPEIPVDIVNLGLIYKLETAPLGDERYGVQVAMTLTAPGCGMGPIIAEDARNRLLAVPGVNEARVEIVFEPPWTQDMISEEGKMELGLI